MYHQLTYFEYKIGLRKGIIPLFIAAVVHEFKKDLIIKDQYNEVPINLDTILQINSKPDEYKLIYLSWNLEKQSYIDKLENIFKQFIVHEEKSLGAYDYIVNAMRRWYLSLPKYTKEIKKNINGSNIDKRFLNFAKLLKQNIVGYELLFDKIPIAFGYNKQCYTGLDENILFAKKYYDSCLNSLRDKLIEEVKVIFAGNANKPILDNLSMTSAIKDWCESLDPKIFEQLFNNGEERTISLLKTVTNDEETFIVRLAKNLTNLRIEDWDNKTVDTFIKNLKDVKNTAEQFRHTVSQNEKLGEISYQIIFVDEKGDMKVKRFEKIEVSKRSNLLKNAIKANLEAMGQAISQQEKRQVLMEILKEMC